MESLFGGSGLLVTLLSALADGRAGAFRLPYVFCFTRWFGLCLCLLGLANRVAGLAGIQILPDQWTKVFVMMGPSFLINFLVRFVVFSIFRVCVRIDPLHLFMFGVFRVFFLGQFLILKYFIFQVLPLSISLLN